jgi:hypothetical protein
MERMEAQRPLYNPFTLEEAQASFRTTFCSKHEDGRIVLLR